VYFSRVRLTDENDQRKALDLGVGEERRRAPKEENVKGAQCKKEIRY